jgi:S1-C subfamily serine protease
LALGCLLAVGLTGQGAIHRTLVAAPEVENRNAGPLAAAFAAAKASVVHVFVEVVGRNSFKIERPGSGVMLGVGGIVLTQLDLVRSAVGADDKRIVVQPIGGAKLQLPAVVLAEHEATGLVLLQVVQMPHDLWYPAVTLAADPQPGDPALVLSFHEGDEHAAFGGVVMEASGGVTLGDGESLQQLGRDAIRLTDAAIQRRSHGAPLLDARGALLGICNASQVGPERSEPTLEELKAPSFGFVIPASAIRKAFPEACAKVVSAPRAEPSATAKAVAAVADAIVAVHTGNGRPAIGLEDPYATRRRRGVGSGVIIASTGLVWTNRHLVDGADLVQVTLRDGQVLKAEVLKSDPGTNSALLKVALPAGKTCLPPKSTMSALNCR